MGNFSINHYTAITAVGDRLRMLSIVDLAEIPTFQELNTLSVRTGIAGLAADPNGRLTPSARASYLAGESTMLARGLHLSADGRAMPLRLVASDLRFLPGAGGLPTERIYLALDGALPPSTMHITFLDTNFPGRAGWKEIVAGATGGATLLAADVPSHDRSLALTIYPTDAISSPPQVLSAGLTVRPGPSVATENSWGVAAIRAAQHGRLAESTPSRHLAAQSWAQQRIDALTTLIAARRLTASMLLLSLLVAFALGAFHALSPGHGKTMVAAFLVGSRGTARQAILLGLTVTVTHTIGVFALGLITLFASSFIVPDQLYPWLGVASGLLIAGMGAALVYRRLTALRRVPARITTLHYRPEEEPVDVRIRA
jgi:hypothetical protein